MCNVRCVIISIVQPCRQELALRDSNLVMGAIPIEEEMQLQ